MGGGSEINSGLYHRTPPEVLEKWRKEFKVDGRANRRCGRILRRARRTCRYRCCPGAAPAASLKLHEGATRLGWKSLEIPRWFRYTPGSTDAGRGSGNP